MTHGIVLSRVHAPALLLEDLDLRALRQTRKVYTKNSLWKLAG